MDAPTPSSIAQGYFCDQNLPASLLGDSDIWIQARMQASGWNILSQLSRTDVNVTIEIFRFEATVAPVPDVSNTLVLLVVAFAFLMGIRPFIMHTA
jgi:hypothetical protein